MKKPLSAFLIVAVFGLFFAPKPAEAVKTGESWTLPEVSGTYDVPGQTKIKLKVFVHNARPGTPPACTAGDPDSEAAVSPTGWKLPPSWSYSINTGTVPSSFRSQFGPVAESAFAKWGQASRVDFVRTAGSTIAKAAMDRVNVIAWGKVSGSTALAVTYTYYYTQTGQVVDQDTIFNNRFAWSYTPYAADICGNPSSYDALNVLTHELGHWLGLDDHYTSEYRNNTMYGYASPGEIKKDTLSTGDISGIKNIYY